jgi:hypothetical protein
MEVNVQLHGSATLLPSSASETTKLEFVRDPSVFPKMLPNPNRRYHLIWALRFISYTFLLQFLIRDQSNCVMYLSSIYEVQKYCTSFASWNCCYTNNFTSRKCLWNDISWCKIRRMHSGWWWSVLVQSRPPLWSGGQSNCLQNQRSKFDSRRYQIFWEVVGLERVPLSLMITTEELLERKSSGSDLENRDYDRRNPTLWPSDTPSICKRWH